MSDHAMALLGLLFWLRYRQLLKSDDPQLTLCPSKSEIRDSCRLTQNLRENHHVSELQLVKDSSQTDSAWDLSLELQQVPDKD